MAEYTYEELSAKWKAACDKQADLGASPRSWLYSALAWAMLALQAKVIDLPNVASHRLSNSHASLATYRRQCAEQRAAKP